MASWKQLIQPPAGALPGNLVTKAGIGVIAVLLVGLVLSQSGGDPETEEPDAGEPGVVGQGVVGQLRSRLTQLEERSLLEEQQRARAAAAAAISPPALPPTRSPAAASEPGAAAALPTAGEVELREPSIKEGLRGEHDVLSAVDSRHAADSTETEAPSGFLPSSRAEAD